MRIEHEIAGILEPVMTVEGLLEVLAEMGFELPAPDALVPDEITELADGVSGLVTHIRELTADLIDGEGSALQKSLEIMNLARQTFQLVRGLQSIDAPSLPPPYGDPTFWTELASDLPGFLLERWVRERHPVSHAVSSFLRIWRRVEVLDDVPGLPDEIPVEYTRLVHGIDLEQIKRFVTEPGPAIADLVMDEDQVDVARIVQTAQMIARLFGLRPPRQTLFYVDGDTIENAATQLVDGLFAVRFMAPGIGDLAAVELSFDHDETGADLGLEIDGGTDASLRLGPDWTLSGSIEGQGGVSFRYVPASGIEVDPDQPSASGGIALIGAPREPWQIFGFGQGPRLTLDGIELSARAALQGAEPDFALKMALQGLRLTVDMSDSDGFVAEALPFDEFEVSFGTELNWSSAGGLRVVGNGPATLAVPVNLSLGPIKIPSLNIGFEPTPDALRALFTVAASAELGIMRASVDGIGVSVELVSAPDGDGAIGPYDIRVGFEPPTGVGFGIGTPDGPISGGGYLSVDRTAGRYEGIIDLKIVKVGITAVVIIDTQALESGAWSMFFALFIRLPSIQLGFGISLEGVGGIAGIHRTLDPEALLAAVRSGALGNVLFPENPIADAPVVIDTFRTLFPPAQGRYVFGPVVKLAWAKGTVSAELGVVIELPDPILVAVLGSISIVLPEIPGTQGEQPDDDEIEPSIVALRLDTAGVFDMEAGTIAVDAYLYDSSIAGFPIGGGMSMRAGFKNNPYFLLSLGGFHPGFPQPEGFPIVPRLSMAIEIAGVIDIGFEAYFAVASNTVQFGSAIHLSADIEIFAIEGGFSFDALFEFDPLRVSIDLDMFVSVRAAGIDLLSVRLAGTADGPKPWVVTAIAEVSIVGYREGIAINKTTGDVASEPAIPPPGLLDLMVGELSAEGAITTESGEDASVMLAESAESGGLAAVAPNATITIAQRIAPLKTGIDRFGTNENVLHQRFRLSATAGAAATIDDASDWFAPGRFRDLGSTDQAKLSAPSFEQMPSGKTVTGGPRAPGARAVQVDHKVTMVDPEGPVLSVPPPDPASDSLDTLVGARTARAVPTSTFSDHLVVADVEAMNVAPVTYVPVDVASGIQVASAGMPFVDAAALAGPGVALVRSFEREAA